jgi:hypothetical protein
MFRSRLTGIAHAEFSCSGGAPRRSETRAVGTNDRPGGWQAEALATLALFTLLSSTGAQAQILPGRASGIPSLIQSFFGQQVRNFEVVVPLASGGLAHYYRDNDAPGAPWMGPNIFGDSVG